MKDFEELKALWKVQEQQEPSSAKVLKQIRQDSRYYTKKILVQMFSVALGILLLLLIGLFFHFHTWTTYIALFILSACLLYYVVIQIKDYRILQKPVAVSLRPSEFIDYLKKYNKKSQLLSRQNYRFYLIGIGVSFLLLLIELSFVLPWWLVGLIFIGTAVWLYVAWAYILKQYIQGRHAYFEDLIRRLTEIKKQFD